MCFTVVPSSLPPPDPVHPSETLISVPCNDSSIFPHSPDQVAPDSSSLAMEAKSEINEDSSDKALEDKSEDSSNNKVLVQGAGTGGSGNQVVDGEASSPPSCPHNVRTFNRPIAHRSHYNPSSSSSGLSPNFDKLDISGDDSDIEGGDNDLYIFPPQLSPSPAVLPLPPPRPLFSVFRPAPRSPPPLGAGLANMGNTCFLNAVMQCFTHTVPLVHGLRSLCNDVVSAHHNDGEFCVLSAVRYHIFRALASPGEVISPYNLVDNLSYISSFFQRFQQEDAHEFLQCLLDKIETCWSKCKVDAKGVSSEGDNLVKQVFGGRLVSQLYCCKCGSRSDTYEPLVDLSLEIEDVDDLDGAFKSFTKMEEIEDDVKISCEKCKEQVPVKKQLLLDQAPSVAALHLKRFKGDGYFVEKIDKALHYPLELDLKPYTVGAQDENVELKYELYAVIVHLGFSSISGHYLCYIRSSPDKWFRIDDSKVTEVTEENALSQQGYILFYAKKGTPWPSSLVKAVCDNGLWNTSPTSVLDIVEHNSYSDPRACLYDENVVESKGHSETSTGLPHAFYDACSVGLSHDSGEGPSSIPRNEVCTEKLVDGNPSSLTGAPKDNEADIFGSVDTQSPIHASDSSQKRKDDMLCNNEEGPCTPRNGVCSEKLIGGRNSSSLTGAPKDNEAGIIGSVDAQSPMLMKDSSKKREYDMFCSEEFGGCDFSVRPTVNEAKSCTPSRGANIEDESGGLNRKSNISPPQWRSSSPDIYAESEKHPEAPCPQPLKKKLKVEKSASLRKTNKTMSAQERKRKEALKSVNKFPIGRRKSLMAAMQQDDMDRNRRRATF